MNDQTLRYISACAYALAAKHYRARQERKILWALSHSHLPASREAAAAERAAAVSALDNLVQSLTQRLDTLAAKHEADIAALRASLDFIKENGRATAERLDARDDEQARHIAYLNATKRDSAGTGGIWVRMFTQQTVSVLCISRHPGLTLVFLVAGDDICNANRLRSTVSQSGWSVLRSVEPDPHVALHCKRVQMPSPSPFFLLEVCLTVATDVGSVGRPLKYVTTNNKCCWNILRFEKLH